jgi:hypothetical protein
MDTPRLFGFNFLPLAVKSSFSHERASRFPRRKAFSHLRPSHHPPTITAAASCCCAVGKALKETLDRPLSSLRRDKCRRRFTRALEPRDGLLCAPDGGGNNSSTHVVKGISGGDCFIGDAS